MGQPEVWKSPRKIQEELNEYCMKRFEDYMQMADRGEIERDLACVALREEIEHTTDLRTSTDLRKSA